jgi:hypothetical protein
LAGKELTIGLYSAERTIVDVFRLRPNIGADVANEAFKRRLRERGNTRPGVQASRNGSRSTRSNVCTSGCGDQQRVVARCDHNSAMIKAGATLRAGSRPEMTGSGLFRHGHLGPQPRYR